jgi:hypothetical protein
VAFFVSAKADNMNNNDDDDDSNNQGWRYWKARDSC